MAGLVCSAVFTGRGQGTIKPQLKDSLAHQLTTHTTITKEKIKWQTVAT